MTEIVYFSRKDRERLSQINAMNLTSELEKERSEILSRRKTLQQMSVQECQNMIVDLNDKIGKMNSIGRVEHTRHFSMMIQELYQRIDTLSRQPRKEVDAVTIREQVSKRNPLSRSRRTKWSARVVNRNTDDPDNGASS